MVFLLHQGKKDGEKYHFLDLYFILLIVIIAPHTHISIIQHIRNSFTKKNI